MCSRELGAIDAETLEWTRPIDATKDRKYKCVECDEYVIIKKGSIRKHHFSHFSKSACEYFDRPNESQIHKDAKLRFARKLKRKTPIWIHVKCSDGCRTYVHVIQYKDGDEVVVEYREPSGKYIADIAVLNGGSVRYIFEIRHTHKTVTQRPEPWFELAAVDDDVDYYCMRERGKCNCCIVRTQHWLRNIPPVVGDIVPEYQTPPCIVCDSTWYRPVYFLYHRRQICPTCIERGVPEDIKRYGIFSKCQF